MNFWHILSSFYRIQYVSRFCTQKIKTPGKGIYLVFNLVKTCLGKGKPKTVLKVYAQLIILNFQKQKKKLLKMFRSLFYFFLIFLGFYGSRSLQIRALFFSGCKTRFYIDFSRNRPSLKCTPRYYVLRRCTVLPARRASL